MASSFKFSNVADLGYTRKLDRIKESEVKLNQRKLTLEKLQNFRDELVSESISDEEHKIKEYEDYEDQWYQLYDDNEHYHTVYEDDPINHIEKVI